MLPLPSASATAWCPGQGRDQRFEAQLEGGGGGCGDAEIGLGADVPKEGCCVDGWEARGELGHARVSEGILRLVGV